MLSAIKLVVTENGRLIETVSKDTNTQPSQLIKSLEAFQESANAALTMLIEQSGGDSGNCGGDADELELEEDEDADDDQVSPKKRKK